MQVNCPNCGEKVPAAHINIQKMTAVCPACDTVFSFDLPEARKAKRRKVKQPARLMLNDDATLQMEFWTNFRLDKNGDFLSSLIFSGSMGFIALLLIATGNVPLLLILGFLIITLAALYRAALVVVNKTHVEMDEDAISVTRKPLPNPFNQGHEVSLAGVTAIKYEETALSKKESYDTQRYLVWAETVDGSRRTIINDVTEDYAVFIAQRLQERLANDANTEQDFSHLEDSQPRVDDKVDAPAVSRTSQNGTRS